MAMAEAKYDLLLIPTKKDGKIYNQPWYKERLKTKYVKSLKPTDTSKFLTGDNWTFLKDGLDDFRDGLPPQSDKGIVLKGSKGLKPNVTGSSSNTDSVKQPVARRRFNKDEICFSRVTPLQQQRRDHIDEIEYGLTQHPLALYPHLEECLPPDVFEDVVDILDPEMNLAEGEDDMEEYDEDDYEDEEPQQQTPELNVPEPQQQTDPEEQALRNQYRWLPRKEEKDNKKKKSDRKPSSPSQDQHINLVTKEFCDWVASLGGESNNIEESTITSLFASGYETKPALSVPIHVVELTNVPPELRMSAAAPPAPQKKAEVPKGQGRKDWKMTGDYQPSWVKFKYGAWYLDPKSWQRRDAEDLLLDPKEIKDQEESESKKKSHGLDSELAPMHGAKAFMEFIDRKSSRRPEFLERVAEIQEQQAREEQAKQEAELAKQKKLAAKQKREEQKQAANAANSNT